MKQYAHIEACYDTPYLGEYCYAFDKLDGSNIRVEFQRKVAKKSSGFCKFGTRHEMIPNEKHPFAPAVDIFMNKYSDDLQRIFIDNRFFQGINKFTIFGEYFGENSFAGLHYPEDVKNVVIFDVQMEKKGFVKPRDFIDIFGHLEIPTLVYQGFLTQEFIDNIRHSELKEGVVCKGVRKTKGNDIVWMTKVKCYSWLQKVKLKMGNDRLFEEFDGDVKSFNEVIDKI